MVSGRRNHTAANHRVSQGGEHPQATARLRWVFLIFNNLNICFAKVHCSQGSEPQTCVWGWGGGEEKRCGSRGWGEATTMTPLARPQGEALTGTRLPERSLEQRPWPRRACSSHFLRTHSASCGVSTRRLMPAACRARSHGAARRRWGEEGDRGPVIRAIGLPAAGRQLGEAAGEQGGLGARSVPGTLAGSGLLRGRPLAGRLTGACGFVRCPTAVQAEPPNSALRGPLSSLHTGQEG